jgi:two-component system osmolarity sensor histidine kinase EnvZ
VTSRLLSWLWLAILGVVGLWRLGGRTIASFMPKGLYARSLLIVILPMVLLQTAVAYVFMQRHYDIVTHRLSASIARDVGALVDLYRALPRGADDQELRKIAEVRFNIDAELTPPQSLPPRVRKRFFDKLDPLIRALPEELAAVLSGPFWVDPVGQSGLMEIRVDLGFGVLKLITSRSLAYEPNAQIFIFWMIGASLLLIIVAILFLRNQIRPILRLAAAAEDFGKGRDVDFQPRGAREVRQAGYAFIEMKRRIERATEQRTAMLNGVSHDLRTILTRFRLSVEMMGETPEGELLLTDIEEMRAMLEGYLAFAKGDAAEPTTVTNLRGILEELRSGSERHGAPVTIESKGDLHLKVRPLAVKRSLGNLISNAQRHAANVFVQALRENRFVIVHVDDDGPGIAPEHREDVFRPFLRLDEARNQDEGGSGLGLAIARDIVRSHGGDITLATSPLGGLRATVRIPV